MEGVTANHASGPAYTQRPHPTHIDLPDPHSSHVRDDLPSPIQMSAGAIDGLESIQAARLAKRGGQSPMSESSSLLQLGIPGFRSSADIALVAMQYLPTPLIVLNNSKTVVLANDAMGRLMALDDNEEDEDYMSDDGKSSTDRLRGKTLTQIGIDVIQDGRYVVQVLVSLDISLTLTGPSGLNGIPYWTDSPTNLLLSTTTT